MKGSYRVFWKVCLVFTVFLSILWLPKIQIWLDWQTDQTISIWDSIEQIRSSIHAMASAWPHFVCGTPAVPWNNIVKTINTKWTYVQIVFLSFQCCQGLCPKTIIWICLLREDFYSSQWLFRCWQETRLTQLGFKRSVLQPWMYESIFRQMGELTDN